MSILPDFIRALTSELPSNIGTVGKTDLLQSNKYNKGKKISIILQFLCSEYYQEKLMTWKVAI